MVTTDCDFYFCSGTGGFYEKGPTGLKLLSDGYAGAGDGNNNPEWEHMKGEGPLPQGKYTIKAVDFTKHPEWKHMGPIIFELVPDVSNVMYGRGSFFIHWDTSAHDDGASEGCIILLWMQNFQRIAKAVTAGKNRLEVGETPWFPPPPVPKPSKVIS